MCVFFFLFFFGLFLGRRLIFNNEKKDRKEESVRTLCLITHMCVMQAVPAAFLVFDCCVSLRIRDERQYNC